MNYLFLSYGLVNHIAWRIHGIDLSQKTFEAGVFLQDVMEDGSGWRRRNFPDGLWGVWFRLTDHQKPVRAITYEYLQTTLQSCPDYRVNGEVVGGRNNYFNHGHYQSGWSYHQYTIGTPLVSSPILNDPANHSFTNNRVRAYHVGFRRLERLVPRKLEVAIASFQFLARQFAGKRHGRPSSLRQQLEASLHRMTTIPIIQSTNILFGDANAD